MRFFDDTIIAQASAVGPGLRGIVRLSGPNALAVLSGIFRPEVPTLSENGIVEGAVFPWEPEQPVPCRLYFWPQGHGYTGQESVELHLCGCGPILEAVSRKLLAAAPEKLRLAEPGEFTLRAFLSGRLDLTQAEAVLGVIDAVDSRHLETALRQLAGGIGRPLHAIQQQLLEMLAHLEAGFDFADEEIDFISPEELQRQIEFALLKFETIRNQIESRADAAEIPKVVLLGEPNVGKSSLYNALIGDAAGAIVSDIPGTTRDYLETSLDWDGVRFRLVDTAGIDTAPGETPDQAAQRLTHRMSEEADLILRCLEFGENVPEPVQSDKPTLLVRTKCDSSIGSADFSKWEIRTSVVTGEGLGRLRESIREMLLNRFGAVEIVPATALRCRDSIERARESLQRALGLSKTASDEALLASEIRLTLDQLGLVLGTIHTEDVLDRIFSRFCVGK